jgi:hypothetical protein
VMMMMMKSSSPVCSRAISVFRDAVHVTAVCGVRGSGGLVALSSKQNRSFIKERLYFAPRFIPHKKAGVHVER